MINPAEAPSSEGGRPRYRSPLREAQAASTRERVLDAAAGLFSATGYLLTTMRQVAEAAGVSIETVYAQGSKQALLLAAVDRALSGGAADGALIESAPVAEALRRDSAEEVIEGFAAALSDIAVRAAGLLVAFEDAAAADPATAEMWAAVEQNRRTDYGRLVARVAELAPLRPGLDVESATDGLWRTVTPRLAHHLLALGWTRDQVAAWTAALGTSTLLRPAPEPRRPA